MLAAGTALALAATIARAEPGCSRCNHGDAAKHAKPAPVMEDSAAQVSLADVPLLDQGGARVRLPTLVDDRIVVMDFVFTTCTTICPVLSAIFTGVQDRLGSALDDDVRLVSVSIDPARDTPARLKAYGEQHRSGPGWTWLTGKPQDVKKVLEGAGAYTPDFRNHAPQILVGDARTNRWYRFTGFPSQERIVAKVNELRALREATSARTEDGR
jgi:cytochrome oxidase Cu insertion factor (SCO1/SenC/PrrC family)